MGLADILDALRDNEDSPRRPRISHEGQIARMRDMADRYTRENPFKVGDLVTPRKDGYTKGAGKPHLVIETRKTDFGYDPRIGKIGTPEHGNTPDMRVLSLYEDRACLAFWFCSSEFNSYVGEA